MPSVADKSSGTLAIEKRQDADGAHGVYEKRDAAYGVYEKRQDADAACGVCVRKDRMRTPRVVFMRNSYAGSAA